MSPYSKTISSSHTAVSNVLSPPNSCSDLYTRKLLDGHLSRALNVELENERLTPIDDSAYVLTLDYTIKMLNIHERSAMCTVFKELAVQC